MNKIIIILFLSTILTQGLFAKVPEISFVPGYCKFEKDVKFSLDFVSKELKRDQSKIYTVLISAVPGYKINN